MSKISSESEVRRGRVNAQRRRVESKHPDRMQLVKCVQMNQFRIKRNQRPQRAIR